MSDLANDISVTGFLAGLHANAMNRAAPLAWHYTSARALPGIMDAGALLPHKSKWDRLARADSITRPKVWFTLDTSWEPTVMPRSMYILQSNDDLGGLVPFADLEPFLKEDVTAAGGGWVRFGYPASSLLTMRELGLFEEVAIPDHEKGGRAHQILSQWRISMKPISISDLSAIDSLDDDLSWRRIWTNPAGIQTTRPSHAR